MGELLDWLVANDPSFRKYAGTVLTATLKVLTLCSRARLPSLYSDFQRQKTTNPDGYEANITAWYNGLCGAASAGALPHCHTRLVLPLDAMLLESLRSSSYGTPAAALASLVDAGVGHGKLVPYETFLNRATSLYERGWALPALPSPVAAATWALRQVPVLGSLLVQKKTAWGKYVLVTNVEAAVTKLHSYLTRPRERLERIVPREVFGKDVAAQLGYDETLSDDDMAVLLRHLERDKRLLVYNEHIIKLCSSTDSERSISQQDTELASIKALQEQLAADETTLSQRVASLTAEAQAALEQKNRPAALRALRRRKALEAVLERRTANLMQIDSVLARIQEASDQVAMVHALEGGAAVLNHLNRETGGVENVHRIVDALQEETMTVEEIGHSLSSAGPVVDEAEVDDELAALEECVKEKEEQERLDSAKAKLDGIPAVPGNVHVKDKEDGTATNKILQDDITGLERLSIDGKAQAGPTKVPETVGAA